uniref:Uncharacterized protein n=1 Tax=Arundo donax TaxID=35708 RepID=A0A0A9HCC8_ARUDO
MSTIESLCWRYQWTYRLRWSSPFLVVAHVMIKRYLRWLETKTCPSSIGMVLSCGSKKITSCFLTANSLGVA